MLFFFLLNFNIESQSAFCYGPVMWLLVLFGAVFLIILFVDSLLVDRRALQLTKQFGGLPRMPIIGTAYGVFLINTAGE